MKKIKVIHLLQSNKFSGAENVVCQIIELFKSDEEYEMFYCSPYGSIVETLNEKKIQFLPINKLSVKNVRRIVKSTNPTIIHAHDGGACIVATLATMFNSNIKVIPHIHGNHMNMRKLGLKSILVKIMSVSWKRIIWVSQSSLDDYIFNKFVRNKSIVLPNVISKSDLHQKVFNDINDYDFDCLFLGRITSIKNPIRALNIFKNVIQELPDLKVAIVGDGELLNECMRFTERNNLQKNIFFMGYMKNPVKILSCSKLLVMTSIYEGTPMSALEAMSFGIPIISTPTDGLLDLILQDDTGFYSNDDEQLSKKIIDYLSNNDKYKEMKNNTSKRFEELMDLDSYKNLLCKLYMGL